MSALDIARVYPLERAARLRSQPRFGWLVLKSCASSRRSISSTIRDRREKRRHDRVIVVAAAVSDVS